jgi:hypothetical protein
MNWWMALTAIGALVVLIGLVSFLKRQPGFRP